MAIDVPKEAKTYTTVYDNFKGIDLTNDPSNVYRRRSPGGVNMLPDLDGRPYKRKGWMIVNPYSDFITAAGYAGDSIIQKRIHHFSLGGQDFMLFFTNIGVFWMSEQNPTIHKCVLAEKNKTTGAITESDFPPEIDGVAVSADPGRSFFFEGSGTAGFYIFVGTELYRFDVSEGMDTPYCWHVEPYVPKVLIACDRYGTGTQLEKVNLLTRKRTIQYLCDGTSTEFGVPGGVKDNEAVVELVDAGGNWIKQTTGYSINGGLLTFTTPPPVTIQGEDNMRITYTPDGGFLVYEDDEQIEEEVESRTATQEAAETGVATLTVEKKRTATTTYTYTKTDTSGSSSTAYTEWTESGAEISPASITLTNATAGGRYCYPSGGETNYMAYNNSITYKPLRSSFTESSPSNTRNFHTTALVTSFTKRPAAVNKDWKIKDITGYDWPGVAAYVQKFYDKHGMTPFTNVVYKSNETQENEYSLTCTASYMQQYTYSATTTKTTTVTNMKYQAGDGEYITNDASAFTACQKSFVYGSGLYNQAFLSSSTFAGYNSRVWYSMADDPTYWPDTNYIEAGGDDTHITGMMKISGYVGIVKQGSALDASVYLAYPTSFESDTTFAVMQSINGIGALSNGAFNILNAEPLFLSAEGVMGVEISNEEVDRRIRSRSYYINKKLCAENNLEHSVSFVFDGLYYLAINNHCYVLDGAQKTSWANERTNLQYECYYLENIPAQCFSSMGGNLYFTDFEGNLCRFKSSSDERPYRDEYSTGLPDVTASSGPVNHVYSKTALGGEIELGSTIQHGKTWYTVTEINDDDVVVTEGVAIRAVWDTISDDDGAVHFFKNLQKKGCLVSLLPGSDTGVRVSLKPDEKDPIVLGSIDASGHILPYEYYAKKKVKKYKRLQIICENNGIDESFGIDQIIKTYTVGNYSKNRK